MINWFNFNFKFFLFCKKDSFLKKNRHDKSLNKLGLKIPFVIILFINSAVSASLSSKCLKIFKSKKAIYSLNDKSLLQNPYSQTVFQQVYQQLPLLEESDLSQKETQKYILQLERLIQHLEKDLNQTNRRLKLLDSYLTPALKKLPNIISSIKSEPALKHESLDTQTILHLTLSTFSRHLLAYLTHSKIESLDWARLRVILESIAGFSEKQQAFSLYKIYRSVREKYSLEEYINCK